MNNSLKFPFRHLLRGTAIVALFLVSFINPVTDDGDNWQTIDQPLHMLNEVQKLIVPPHFKNQSFRITDYGAKGDGLTLNTDAFRKAIEACSAKGGGNVIVPDGNFLTGPIYLKSNVNLHLEDKAVIEFTHDLEKYPLVLTRWEGSDCMNFSPQIYAYHERNIAVTGNGTIKGGASAKYWWPWKGISRFGWHQGEPNQFKDRDALHKLMQTEIDPRKRIFGIGHYLRPYMFQPYECQNILVSGVTMIDSPMWFISPVMCDNITVEKVTIAAEGPNTDGCDPDACKNVLISNCSFDTGDDCIAIKSGRDEDGRNHHRPAENHIIQNCDMKAGHGGITIGSEIAGGAKNIFALNCKLSSPNLSMILRLKTSSSRGGTIENVFVKDIQAGICNEAAVHCDMFYENPGEHMPTIRNVWVENLTVAKGGKYGIYVHAYEQSPLKNFKMFNCKIDGVKTAVQADYTAGLQMNKVFINGKLITSVDSILNSNKK